MLAKCPSVAPDQHFRMFSSSYKDSNTLHLPTERFSPVRRFSDGAASIQAFKAHLEKMGNNSSIKQLQQVMRGHHHTPKASPGGCGNQPGVGLFSLLRLSHLCHNN